VQSWSWESESEIIIAVISALSSAGTYIFSAHTLERVG